MSFGGARQTSKKPSLQELACVALSALCSIYKTPIVSRKSGCRIIAMVIGACQARSPGVNRRKTGESNLQDFFN